MISPIYVEFGVRGKVSAESSRSLMLSLFQVLSRSILQVHCCAGSPLPAPPNESLESAVQVAFFLPQLVQLLRADEGGMIQEFLFTAARRSTLFGHKLVCTLRVRLSQC